jgi:hypothetical protein
MENETRKRGINMWRARTKYEIEQITKYRKRQKCCAYATIVLCIACSLIVAG